MPGDLKECGTAINDGGRLEELKILVSDPWGFIKKTASAMWYNGKEIRREFSETWTAFRAHDFEGIGHNMGEFFVEVFFYSKYMKDQGQDIPYDEDFLALLEKHQ